VKLAVFVSGRGSNLRAIIESEQLRNLAEVVAVVSDKLNCGAFEIAQERGIPCFSVSQKAKDGFVSFAEIIKTLDELKIDLVALAGFLKLIPPEFVSHFNNKIINIHPALLPSFGGEGMYGMNVHKAVFESSAKVSGPTVHFVDEEYDKGRIIAQKCVDISDAASPEEIAGMVLKAEHILLPDVIAKIALGKVARQDNRIIILK
jgi:formyltetrahydrofolate-dependent phosphoribosylglycinamide formyltransferase